jgi:hypothetical protein
MEVADVSPALQDRLGPEATAGLLDLFNTARQEWTTDVTTAAVERFEGRLLAETSDIRVAVAHSEAALRLEIAGLRGEMREGNASLRQEMTHGHASLRQEMSEALAGLRQEMRDGFSGLRQEMTGADAALRQDMVAGRFELVKWCFAFWVGQVVAIAAVVGVMFRFIR